MLVEGAAAAGAEETSRTVIAQGVRKTVAWSRASEVLPALVYEGGRPLFPAVLEGMTFPKGHLLVPLGVTYIPWYEDVPVVDDSGRLGGSMHADGITRMVFSFPPRLARSQFTFAKAKDWVVGGFLEEGMIPEVPWRSRCIYVLLITDTREHRSVVAQVAGLGELLRIADGVIEILTENARVERPPPASVPDAAQPAAAAPVAAEEN